jgi:hypothetical protein
MRLHRCWLDSGLIRVHVSNVLIQEWLPASDIGIDGRKVGCRLVRVGERRGKGLRLGPKHACGSIGRGGLQMSVGVSKVGSVLLLRCACIGRRAWRRTGTSRQESCPYPRGMTPMGRLAVCGP